MTGRRTWHLIACFGALNASYATIVTWLGPQLAVRGLTTENVGSLLAVMSICQAISALVVPPLLSRSGDRRPALMFCTICQGVGFALLIPDIAPPLVTLLIMGLGLGGTFAGMIVAVLDCAADRDEAMKLGAAVQGGGFLLNAAAPLIAALLLEASGDFRAIWVAHLVLLLVALPLVLTMPRSPAAASDPLRPRPA